MPNIVKLEDYDYICTYCAAAIPAPEALACRPCMRKLHRGAFPVQSVDLACLLGLFPTRPGSSSLSIPYLREMIEEPDWITEEMRGALAHITDVEYRRLIFSRFCAIYLPVLSDAFPTSNLPPPHVTSPRDEAWFERCMMLLARTCENRFFAKFCTSKKEAASGKEAMAEAIAQRMVNGEASTTMRLERGTVGSYTSSSL